MRDRIRQEINRYERRMRGKPLPEGMDRWEFTCRIGTSAEAAKAIPFKALPAAIDTVAATGSPTVFVELLARPTGRSRA